MVWILLRAKKFKQLLCYEGNANQFAGQMGYQVRLMNTFYVKIFFFIKTIRLFRATVLYDRPAAQFQPITLEQKHDFFFRLATDYHEFLPISINSDECQATRFTYKDSDGTVHLRDDRPAVLVSSTSWTPDEDFSILLKALDRKCCSCFNTITWDIHKNPFFRLWKYCQRRTVTLSTSILHNHWKRTSKIPIHGSNCKAKLQACYNRYTMAYNWRLSIVFGISWFGSMFALQFQWPRSSNESCWHVWFCSSCLCC